jgi:hypothetical protein
MSAVARMRKMFPTPRSNQDIYRINWSKYATPMPFNLSILCAVLNCELYKASFPAHFRSLYVFPSKICGFQNQGKSRPCFAVRGTVTQPICWLQNRITDATMSPPCFLSRFLAISDDYSMPPNALSLRLLLQMRGKNGFGRVNGVQKMSRSRHGHPRCLEMSLRCSSNEPIASMLALLAGRNIPNVVEDTAHVEW